jgi:hypothetical protein
VYLSYIMASLVFVCVVGVVYSKVLADVTSEETRARISSMLAQLLEVRAEYMQQESAIQTKAVSIGQDTSFITGLNGIIDTFYAGQMEAMVL